MSDDSNKQEEMIWLDGQFMGLMEAKSSVLSHALHYGTGVFEGIRVYKTSQGVAIFRLCEHLERMKQGAQELDINLNIDHLAKLIQELLTKSRMEYAYVRPIAFYGTGGLSLDVASNKPHLVVAILKWKSHLGDETDSKGVRLAISRWRRTPANSVPALKLCGAYVNSILAKLDASKRGFDEALFIDSYGWVCEATGENLFMVQKGEVIACQHSDALPGITRATVMELTGAKEKRLSREDLHLADEVFLTGTSAEITPVSSVEDQNYSMGPITREIQDLYRKTVTGQIPKYEKWLTLVQKDARR